MPLHNIRVHTPARALGAGRHWPGVATPAKRSDSGFTLIELVLCVVILATLAAVAVPRLIVLKDAANQGQVESMAAALHQAAITGHVRCELLPACAATTKTGFGFVTYLGRSWRFNGGYPEAGDVIGGDQIDSLVVTNGFTVSLPNNLTTRFALTTAPTPANCSVDYKQADGTGPPSITVKTSGC